MLYREGKLIEYIQRIGRARVYSARGVIRMLYREGKLIEYIQLGFTQLGM